VLKGKNILLGITGSIAAYKSVDLARRLVEEGAHVTVVMTESACRFVSPLTFETVSRKPTYTNLYEGYVSHISLVKESDFFIIAPATANTINKLAQGIADNLLTTLWLSYEGPSLLAPAMNSRMYKNSFVKKSLRALEKRGINLVGPESGSLACGEEGVGKMADISDIAEAVRTSLSPKNLSGQRMLITAGPTREFIDPVRYLSNCSSGKMGFSLAKAAFRRGAEVTLVSGPTGQRPPGGISFIPVQKSAEMSTAVLKALRKSTSVIMAAAVADFTPLYSGKTKFPKANTFNMQLKKTPDILEKIGKAKGNRILVGFAAETGKNIENAKKKLKQKNLDLIVLNDITRKGAGFEVDTNIVTLIDREGKITEYPLMKKEEVAEHILNHIIQLQSLKK
jgi:phosphopantothenoylcysteine decarboxylase/phosphopantothenate--cysteine ligase